MSSDSMSLPSNRFIADEKYNQNVNLNHNQINKQIDIQISKDVLSVNHLDNPNNTDMTLSTNQKSSLGFTQDIQNLVNSNQNNGSK